MKKKDCNKLIIDRKKDSCIVNGKGFQIDITSDYLSLLKILEDTPDMELSDAINLISELFNYKGHSLINYEDEKHGVDQFILYLKDNQRGIASSIMIFKDKLRILKEIRDNSITGQVIDGIKKGNKPD